MAWVFAYGDISATNKSRSFTFRGLAAGTPYNVQVTVTFTNGHSYSDQMVAYTT